MTTHKHSKMLITHSLEEASEWILNNVEGLREFELRIRLSSDDLSPSPPKELKRPTNLRKWWPEEFR